MEGAALIAQGLDRIAGSLERSLTGVSVDELCRVPGEGTNSMAWLAWHLTRVQDDHLMNLAGRPLAWAEEGWHKRFGMPAENDFGMGWPPEQVQAFTCESAEVLLAHHRAVLARSKAYLATVTPGDLDRVLDEPRWDPRPTVGVRLVSVISDNTQHAGQIAYLRGLFGGYGWQRS